MNMFEKETTYAAVVYADGGANPNPGFAGSGVHSYFFKSEKSLNYKKCSKPQVYTNHFLQYFNQEGVKLDYFTITKNGYVDYGQNNTDLSDSVVNPDFYLDFCYSFFEPTTNNAAELRAVSIFLDEVLEKKDLVLSDITFILDSQYVITTLERFASQYEKNNWLKSDGTEPKNLYEIKEIVYKLKILKDSGCTINYKWVKGHSGNNGNGMADYLATLGLRRARNNDNDNKALWSHSKKYWDVDSSQHPLLFSPRCYFNSQSQFNKKGNYYLIEPSGDDIVIGKRDNEGYSVVQLKTPCFALEAVIEARGQVAQQENKIVIGKMERIYDKFVQKFSRLHGNYVFSCSENKTATVFLDTLPVAVDRTPPGLIHNVTSAFQNLDERLNEFIKLKNENGVFSTLIDRLEFVDITNVFYKKDSKKNTTLNDIFIVGSKNISVDIELAGKKRKIPFCLGLDLPKRNSLKKLEKDNPALYLLTWRTSPESLQYACVVECDSGIGIWSNYFCNRIFTT